MYCVMGFCFGGNNNELCNEVLFWETTMYCVMGCCLGGNNNVLCNESLISILGDNNVLFLLLFIKNNTLLYYHLHLEYHFNTFI